MQSIEELKESFWLAMEDLTSNETSDSDREKMAKFILDASRFHPLRGFYAGNVGKLIAEKK
jgi:hypothetical protein